MTNNIISEEQLVPMIECSSCGKQSGMIAYCPDCSEFFCKDCVDGSDELVCPRCHREALKVNLTSANVPECDFEWIEIAGKVSGRIGVCDLSRIPAKISIKNLLVLSSVDVEYVICRDSESVDRNSTALSIQMAAKTGNGSPGLPILSGMPFSSSAFRAVYRWDKKPLNVVFLNVSALDSGEMEFMLRYIKEQYSVFRSVNVDSSRLRRTIFETEWEMQRRYGFRPRLDPEATDSLVNRAHLPLVRTWVDHTTLKNLLHTSDQSEISRYVSRRLKLMREGLPLLISNIVMWGSFYEFFGHYLSICCICMALPLVTI